MNWGIEVLQTSALPLGYGTEYEVLQGRGERKAPQTLSAALLMEVPPRFELGNRGFADLCLTTWLWYQIRSETKHSVYGASDEARTRYLHLGKVALYQMSYTRILVPP